MALRRRNAPPTTSCKRLTLISIIVLALVLILSKNNAVNSSISSLLPGSAISGTASSASLVMSRLFQNADAKIAERNDWITKGPESQIFGKLKGAELWYLFPPFLPCFWSLEKNPGVAKLHDGGKWLCGINEVHEYLQTPSKEYGVSKHYEARRCVVYSMGSGDNFIFEERVRKLAPGCEIHTFDPTKKETGKGKPFYDMYHGDYGFGGIDSSEGRFPVKSLATIMKELQHPHIDYLKIDVEGFEWSFLDDIDWSTVRVGQLLMELHPDTGERIFGKDPNAKEMNKKFNKLEKAGFYLISVEPVTYTNYGQVEVVFIHKDWQPQGWKSPP